MREDFVYKEEEFCRNSWITISRKHDEFIGKIYCKIAGIYSVFPKLIDGFNHACKRKF